MNNPISSNAMRLDRRVAATRCRYLQQRKVNTSSPFDNDMNIPDLCRGPSLIRRHMRELFRSRPSEGFPRGFRGVGARQNRPTSHLPRIIRFVNLRIRNIYIIRLNGRKPSGVYTCRVSTWKVRLTNGGLQLCILAPILLQTL
jgi:hypothetical protein